ncbi:MAG: protein phosphatase 2C domain-containing protein [Candidatus Competibacteraceae bacterium]|nr:protein phosphatase 2C domain-containing protein [Candidatus Competibacteraceae bacterium]
MSENDRWRVVQASVAGVAHRHSGIECQDVCATQTLFMTDDKSALVLVAADGAGSAVQARAGAQLTCQALLTECANWLAEANDDWQPMVASCWLHRIQAALTQQAAEAGLPLREFACTLMGAVITSDQALFLQIGDGAIVIGSNDGYQTVFWPQSGQYPNETWFVTDPNATSHLECITLTESIAEIALLTDGLQPLALHYQNRHAHEPFFRPMFQRLRDYPENASSAALTQALEQFLDSPAVNQRTHDDKTLILATRLAAPETVPAIPMEGEAAPMTGLRDDAGDEAL